MRLTYGNIRKSKILKFYFYDFFSNGLNENYYSEFQKYQNTIQNEEFKGYNIVSKYLHDAKVKIRKSVNDIIFDLVYYYNDDHTWKTGVLIFRDAKIISWNKFKKSGHISKLNKMFVSLEYGYDEFYNDNGEKLVSIIFFYDRFSTKINRGYFYPMFTMKYKKIEFCLTTAST